MGFLGTGAASKKKSTGLLERRMQNIKKAEESEGVPEANADQEQ